MIPRLVTAPSQAPVTLEELKRDVRAEGFTDDDALLSSKIDAAVAELDGYAGLLGRCIVTQTWAVDHAAWSDIRLPFPDVASVTVTWFDAEGAEQDVDSGDVVLIHDARGALVRFRPEFSRPALDPARPFPVTAEFVAGFGGPSQVPADLRGAILLRAAQMYTYPDGALPRIAEDYWSRLIAKYRRLPW